MANQKKTQNNNSNKKAQNCRSRSKSEDNTSDEKKKSSLEPASPLAQSGAPKERAGNAHAEPQPVIPQENVIFPDIVPSTTYTGGMVPITPEPKSRMKDGSAAAAKKPNAERDTNIAGIVILLLVAAFIIFVIIATAGGMAKAQSGSLSGDKSLRYGKTGVVTYDLGETKLSPNDQIVWYFGDKEVQRKPLSDKSALSYAVKGDKLGTQKLKVIAGDKVFCECDVTVVKPALNVLVEKRTVCYGDDLPDQNYTVSGFIEGEGQSDYPPAKVYYTEYGKTQAAAPSKAGIYNARIEHNYPGDVYDLKIKESTMEILPRKVTVTGKITKTYDGTNYVETPMLAVTNVLSGDEVYAVCEKLFISDKNVGEKQSGTYNVVLSGKDAANYVIDSYDVSVTVTPKKLTVTNVKVNDKVYDGTNKTVFGSTGKLSGVVAGDVVEIGGIEGYYPNSQIGRNKSVVIKKIELVGRDSANYTLGEYPKVYSSIHRFDSAEMPNQANTD